MALIYKIDIMQALKEKGYTTYRLRNEKIIGERQIQQIRNSEVVSLACLDKLCHLLQCQIGDIIEYKSEEK